MSARKVPACPYIVRHAAQNRNMYKSASKPVQRETMRFQNGNEIRSRTLRGLVQIAGRLLVASQPGTSLVELGAGLGLGISRSASPAFSGGGNA